MKTVFKTGYIAGIIGFLTGIYLLAAFKGLNVFNASMRWFLIVTLIVILEFLAGMTGAYVEGIGYGVGLLSTELLLQDYESTFLATLGFVGHILGFVIKTGLFGRY